MEQESSKSFSSDESKSPNDDKVHTIEDYPNKTSAKLPEPTEDSHEVSIWREAPGRSLILVVRFQNLFVCGHI